MTRYGSSAALRATRLTFCFIGALLFLRCPSADAQQATRIPRIGYVSVSGAPEKPGPFLEAAFHEAASARVNGIIIVGSRVINRYGKELIELPIRNRLPSMYEVSGYVERGGLMSYSADEIELFRRAAWYLDKILKGVKPAELPIEQPSKFELVINLRTANQLGLTIPPALLARADKVIR
jgi:putative ABC transport system substrate-binding protein